MAYFLTVPKIKNALKHLKTLLNNLSINYKQDKTTPRKDKLVSDVDVVWFRVNMKYCHLLLMSHLQ